MKLTVTSLAFSPNNSSLWIGCDDGTVSETSIHNARLTNPRPKFHNDGIVRRIAVNQDGTKIAVAIGDEGRFFLWNSPNLFTQRRGRQTDFQSCILTRRETTGNSKHRRHSDWEVQGMENIATFASGGLSALSKWRSSPPTAKRSSPPATTASSASGTFNHSGHRANRQGAGRTEVSVPPIGKVVTQPRFQIQTAAGKETKRCFRLGNEP